MSEPLLVGVVLLPLELVQEDWRIEIAMMLRLEEDEQRN